MPCKNIMNYKLDMHEKKELTWSFISAFGTLKTYMYSSVVEVIGWEYGPT